MRFPGHRSRRAAWEAAVAIALCVSGCGRHEKADDASRPIEVLVANDAETLDPRYATDAVGLRATRLLHAGLIHLDSHLQPEPYMAERWRWIDDRTLDVRLRADARFHSGAPLTARDVVATLRAFASPAVASRHARVVEAIAGVEARGDDEVVIRLARPHATLLTDLELPILRADQAESPPAPDGTLDGLGPFAVARVARGEVDLVPAVTGAHGWGTPMHAVTLRTVHDENARALRLEAGRADVAVNLISPTLLPAIASQPGLEVRETPGANLTYVVVQHERAPLGDARVRRAVSLAIDRAMICRTLFAQRAYPAGALVAPVHWAHVDLPPLAFDPAGARALLAEAGVGGAHVTLLTSPDRLRVDVARVVAQQLGDVGLAAEVVPLELGTMLARLAGGDFDLAILQLPEMTEPNVLRVFLHSQSIPPGGANRGRVRSAELDALLDEGDRVLERDARREVYARFERAQRDLMAVVPLWYEAQVWITTDRARGFWPSAEGRWLSLAALP